MELPGSVCRADLETFVHGLLWEEAVLDRRRQPVQILRMKVGPTLNTARPAEAGRGREEDRLCADPPWASSICPDQLHSHTLNERPRAGPAHNGACLPHEYKR